MVGALDSLIYMYIPIKQDWHRLYCVGQFILITKNLQGSNAKSQVSDIGPVFLLLYALLCFLSKASVLTYRIRGNFRGLPIFAVFRGQYETAKIKIAKYFPISVKESSLEATSIFAAFTSGFPLFR